VARHRFSPACWAFPRTVFIESGIKAFFEKTLVYPKQIRAKPSKSRGEPGWSNPQQCLFARTLSQNCGDLARSARFSPARKFLDLLSITTQTQSLACNSGMMDAHDSRRHGCCWNRVSGLWHRITAAQQGWTIKEEKLCRDGRAKQKGPNGEPTGLRSICTSHHQSATCASWSPFELMNSTCSARLPAVTTWLIGWPRKPKCGAACRQVLYTNGQASRSPWTEQRKQLQRTLRRVAPGSLCARHPVEGTVPGLRPRSLWARAQIEFPLRWRELQRTSPIWPFLLSVS